MDSGFDKGRGSELKPPHVKGMDTREMLVVALNSRGVQLTAVASAREALEALPTVRLHVIVSDIGIAGDDSLALVRHLRGLPAEAGGRTPAIAVSGYLPPETRRRVLEAGFQAVLAKPIAPDELVGTVRRLGRSDADA